MFPLPEKLRRPLLHYRQMVHSYDEQVRANPRYWSLDLKERAIEFARHSARLSDADSAEIPTKASYTENEKNEHPWLRAFFDNDVTLAEIVLRPRRPLGREVNAVCINAPLCGHRMSPRWRTTWSNNLQAVIPQGINGKVMYDEWCKVVRRGSWFYRHAEDTDRRAFAFAMYDAFIYLRPFRDGNGRTARLVIQYILQELRLAPIPFYMDFRESYQTRSQYFEDHIMEPFLKERLKKV